MPFPDLPDHHKAHHSRHHHRAGNRDAVGGRQRTRRAEQDHQHQNDDQQEDVDARNVDLARMSFRRVPDLKTRHQAELNRLPRQRISTGDDSLARDHGCHGCKDHHRHQRPVREHQEERIFDRVRPTHHQCCLTEIIQRQRREHEKQPRALDRTLTEMAEIGIERFRTCDGEKDRTQGHQTDIAMSKQERDRIGRIECRQHPGLLRDQWKRGHGDHREPETHDGAEKRRHTRRAARLNREQRDENEHRDGNDVVIERGCRQLDALDRR